MRCSRLRFSARRLCCFLPPFLSGGRAPQGRRAAFALSGLVTLLGGTVLTILVNVPMNEALSALAVPEDQATAAQIWQDYSPR